MVVVVVIENYKEMQIAMKVRVGTVAERKKEGKKVFVGEGGKGCRGATNDDARKWRIRG